MKKPTGSVMGKVAGAKNWLILGAAVVGSYFVYKKVISPMMSDSGGGRAEAPSKSVSPSETKTQAPDMNGPAVRKGVLASSRSPICITTKVAGMKYAAVSSTDAQGYNSFTPPVNGKFTRRFLCVGTTKFAEIKPV